MCLVDVSSRQYTKKDLKILDCKFEKQGGDTLWFVGVSTEYWIEVCGKGL